MFHPIWKSPSFILFLFILLFYLCGKRLCGIIVLQCLSPFLMGPLYSAFILISESKTLTFVQWILNYQSSKGYFSLAEVFRRYSGLHQGVEVGVDRRLVEDFEAWRRKNQLQLNIQKTKKWSWTSKKASNTSNQIYWGRQHGDGTVPVGLVG